MSRSTGLKKRSVRIAGHDTSITMEDAFWDVLQNIAQEKDVSINALVSEVDATNQGNLSSALRVYILQYILAQ